MALTDWLMPGASVVGAGMNMLSTALTNKSQKELARYQFDLNKEMWNLQNEYNKPVNQVQRLKEAGLSPQLQYGNGSLTGNTTGNMPQYDAPNLHAYQGFGNDLTAAAASYANSRKLDSEIKLLENQADAAKANELQTIARTPGVRAESLMRQYEAEVHQEFLRNKIDRQVADLQELDARIRNLDADTKNKITSNAEIIARTALANSNIKLNDARINEIAAHIRQLTVSADIDEFYANLARSGIDPGKYSSGWERLINSILAFFQGKSLEEMINDHLKKHPKRAAATKNGIDMMNERVASGQSILR